MSTIAAPGLGRPAADEHAPYYAKYTSRIADANVIDVLERQAQEIGDFLRAIPSNLHDHRYGEGKWSIKEVVGHVSDAERIFAYRALRFARGDATPLATFDENAYVPAGEFGERDFASLVDEWLRVRAATVALFGSFTPEQGVRRGIASGQEVSVRALGHIIAGHVDHHAAILRERYLGQS
jgi:hypothetical protein